MSVTTTGPEIIEAQASSPRSTFHLCLASIILPVVSLPFEWALAMAGLRRRWQRPEETSWSRWLVALAVVDTVVAALVIALFSSGVWGWHAFTTRASRPRTGEAVRIGVSLNAVPDGTDGARIERVDGDSPAERAGLLPADIVIAIDGQPTRDPDSAQAQILAGAPGAPRTLRVWRNGADIEIVVVPELRRARPLPPRALLAVTPVASCVDGAMRSSKAFLAWPGLAVVTGSMLALASLEWRRQRRARGVWLWAIAALIAGSLAGLLAALGVCTSMGGDSVASWLAAHFTDGLVLSTTAVVAMRRMRGAETADAQAGSLVPAGRAVALGFFYLAAVNIRLNIMMRAVEAFAGSSLPAVAAQATGATRFPGLDFSGEVLLWTNVVFLVPVAEEVLFRGVILPRLVSWMGGAGAVVVTSALFAALHSLLDAVCVFEIALLLGWARLRTGGLAAPIAIHMIVNGLWMLHRMIT